jgi:hypothetical protein
VGAGTAGITLARNLKIENLGPEKDEWDHPLKGTLSKKYFPQQEHSFFEGCQARHDC